VTGVQTCALPISGKAHSGSIDGEELKAFSILRLDPDGAVLAAVEGGLDRGVFK
jgi:hypothetical protein